MNDFLQKAKALKRAKAPFEVKVNSTYIRCCDENHCLIET